MSRGGRVAWHLDGSVDDVIKNQDKMTVEDKLMVRRAIERLQLELNAQAERDRQQIESAQLQVTRYDYA
jgi:hypothetical protein